MNYKIKNIIFILIAILIVIGAFVFAEYRNIKTKNTYVAQENVDISSEYTSSEIDNDNDGLKDWEEILLGTNPNDPKSKGEFSKDSSTEKTTEKRAPLTSTELLSRDFFARYMELRQLGISNDKESVDEAINQSVGNIVGSIQAKTYTIADISTKEDISKGSIEQYGSTVENILTKNAIKSRNEMIILKDALDKEDYKILAELDPIINGYKNMLNQLLKVDAPVSVSTLHLDLINSLSGLIFVSESFKKVENDPVAGIQGTANYFRYAELFSNSYTGIISYLTFIGIKN